MRFVVRLKTLERCFVLLTLSVFLLAVAGCSSAAGMIEANKEIGMEADTLRSMEMSEIAYLIKRDVNIESLKTSPAMALGSYVRLQGQADVSGAKKFISKNQFACILEESVYIIGMGGNETIADGDMIEVTGLVSRSNYFNLMKDVKFEKELPDMVTVIAKEIRFIKSENRFSRNW